jgi:plasmid replication initiation protein
MKVFLYSLSILDKESLSSTFKLIDLEHHVDLKVHYRQTKELLEEVKNISIDNSNRDLKKLEYINIYSKVKYDDTDKTFTFEFNKDLRDELVDFKRNYTRYYLGYISYLSSKYTIKLYQIFKQNQNLKRITYNVDTLKSLLQLPDSYNYGVIKKRILHDSITEISALTDLTITYKEKKEGRKVVGVNFFITKKFKDVMEKKVFGVEEYIGKNVLVNGEVYRNIQNIIYDLNNDDKDKRNDLLVTFYNTDRYVRYKTVDQIDRSIEEFEHQGSLLD